MNPRRALLIGGLALASAIAGGVAADGAGQVPKGGFFTDAQAASGEAVYRQSCASCHGAALRGGTAPPLVGPAVRGELGQSPRHARRSLLHHADDDAAASVERGVAAGSRRRVRLHHEGERLCGRLHAAVGQLGAVEARTSPGHAASSRLRGAPAARIHPRRGRRRRGHQRTRSGDVERVGALDRLAVPQPRLRRHALFAARSDRRVQRLPPRAGVHVPDGRARQLSNQSARVQRHDVRDDDDEHGGARRHDLPDEVASYVGDERRPGVSAQSRRRASRTDASSAGRRTATCSRSTPRRAACSGRGRWRSRPTARRSRWRR